jgi:Peptidase inhibitor I9
MQNLQLLQSDAYEEIHRFNLPGFTGYAARLPQQLLHWLADHHDVAFIEQDRTISINAPKHHNMPVFAAGVQSQTPAWGLVRVASRDLPKNDTVYTYPDSAGTGVDAYIIDTVLSSKARVYLPSIQSLKEGLFSERASPRMA